MELEAGVLIAIVSLAVSFVSLLFTYSQVRVATKTTKAEIAITLIDQLYSDKSVQSLLQKVYDGKLSMQRSSDGFCGVFYADGTSMVDATGDIDSLLNRFQIIGHLFSIGVLQLKDLQGLRYEIICLGRNEAVRAYLGFLASDYQAISGIRHDHFGYFKNLYRAFEYDPTSREAMSSRLKTAGNSQSAQGTSAHGRESESSAPILKPEADGPC